MLIVFLRLESNMPNFVEGHYNCQDHYQFLQQEIMSGYHQTQIESLSVRIT